MNTSTIVALSSLAVSVIGTLVIPYVNNQYKNFKLKVEFNNFENLINTEYIKELDSWFATYTDITSKDMQMFIKEKQKRLNELKHEEVLYVNNENQFKMIRLIELVKQYFKLIGFIESVHMENGFGVITSGLQYHEHIELKRNEFSNLQKKFQEVKIDYLELKTDHLILNVSDYLTKFHSEFYEITDLIKSKKKNLS